MNIYILLIIVSILFLIVLKTFKDLFCPSSILCMSYILAIFSAIYNIDIWRYYINNNTVFIISIGLLCFIITSLIQYFIKYKNKELNAELYVHKEIKIKKDIMVILNIISIIIFLVYAYYFIKGIGGFSAFSNFSYEMRKYRFDLLEGDVDFIPSFVNLISKYCRALALVSGYIFINNIIYYKNNNIKKKNLFQYFLSIIIFVPFPLMTGSRFDLISFMIYLIMVWYITMKKYYKFKINFSKFFKLTFLLVIIVLIFSQSRTLVGRDDDSDTLSYVTTYFGGSIVMFDMYLNEPHSLEQYFGQELFSNLRKFLSQIHLIDEASINVTTGNFRISPSGVIIGNVYTAFRKMYNDFGLFGVCFFQVLMAIIFNSGYYSCLYKKNNNLINLEVIVYSCLTFCLFFHSYSETFFSTVISFNYFVLFFIVYIICSYFFKLKIR